MIEDAFVQGQKGTTRGEGGEEPRDFRGQSGELLFELSGRLIARRRANRVVTPCTNRHFCVCAKQPWTQLSLVLIKFRSHVRVHVRRTSVDLRSVS